MACSYGTVLGINSDSHIDSHQHTSTHCPHSRMCTQRLPSMPLVRVDSVPQQTLCFTWYLFACRWLKRVYSLRRVRVEQGFLCPWLVWHCVRSWHPCAGSCNLRGTGLPSPMAKRTANAPLEINTHGASLTDFAQAMEVQVNRDCWKLAFVTEEPTV